MDAKRTGLAAAAAAGAIAIIVTGTAAAGQAVAGTAVAAAPAGADVLNVDPAAAPASTDDTTAPATPGGPADGSGPDGHAHTPATAAELTKVKAAVKKKDATITVEGAMKDADGSFDAFGTKGTDRVRIEVSKDYATVTVQTGGFGGPGSRGGPGGFGGPGGERGHGRGGFERGTAVAGAELTKVKAAITAKDKSVTVDAVVKLDDGSYRAVGSKAADRVLVTVSKDLKTVTVDAAPAGGPGRAAPGTAATATELAKIKAAVTAKDKAVTIDRAVKVPDGSYLAFGTKDGAPVAVQLSADLTTVTVRTGEFGHARGGFQRGTAVTGAELTKVKAAITAKDKSVTVEGVVSLDDGSFRAFGTKGSDRVLVTVSKDLKTVTIETGRGPGHR